MREITPAVNMSIDAVIKNSPESVKKLVETIREAKKNGGRPLPSSKLIDESSILEKEIRLFLLDEVARLVDENLFGRSDMCIQFAMLMQKALTELDVDCRSVCGECMYYLKGKEIYRWKHSWVRVGKEVIDGNVDILFENPMVPDSVQVKPYWGPVSMIPRDRRLRESRGELLPPDEDIENIWWPDLRTQLRV